MVAFLIGFLGAALSAFVGIDVYGLTPLEVFWAVFGSNAAGFLSLLGIVRGQSSPWIRSKILTGTRSTWSVFAISYFSLLWVFAEPVREPSMFLGMAAPLILAAQFQVHLFGAVQDRWVARRQRLSRVL